MDNYIIDKVNENHIDKIVDIYNSNETFLKNHMGISSISKDFILNEIKEMRAAGFTSSIIKSNKGEIVGVCDFKISYEEAYLSLLMIDSKYKGRGLGSKIYNHLEKSFKSKNVNNIRIDVVYDYEENVLVFWEKQGFIPCEKIQLQWNNYEFKAIKMNKTI